MTRPTRERLEEIRGVLTLYEIGPFNEDMVIELFAEIHALEAENKELQEPAKFGWQCYQDRCENAYIEASVVKRLGNERDRLQERVRKLETLLVEAQTRLEDGDNSDRLYCEINEAL